MLGNDTSVLADYDAVGAGVILLTGALEQRGLRSLAIPVARRASEAAAADDGCGAG